MGNVSWCVQRQLPVTDRLWGRLEINVEYSKAVSATYSNLVCGFVNKKENTLKIADLN